MVHLNYVPTEEEHKYTQFFILAILSATVVVPENKSWLIKKKKKFAFLDIIII